MNPFAQLKILGSLVESVRTAAMKPPHHSQGDDDVIDDLHNCWHYARQMAQQIATIEAAQSVSIEQLLYNGMVQHIMNIASASSVSSSPASSSSSSVSVVPVVVPVAPVVVPVVVAPTSSTFVVAHGNALYADNLRATDLSAFSGAVIIMSRADHSGVRRLMPHQLAFAKLVAAKGADWYHAQANALRRTAEYRQGERMRQGFELDTQAQSMRVYNKLCDDMKELDEEEVVAASSSSSSKRQHEDDAEDEGDEPTQKKAKETNVVDDK